MQLYDQLLASAPAAGRPEAMMMVPMPYDRGRVRGPSSWQASGAVGRGAQSGLLPRASLA